MEHEIIKHSRRIFTLSKNVSESIVKKTTEIVIEIFIIVFAVSFSIWLHGITEHRKEQKEARAFLNSSKNDLIKDLKWLQADVETWKKSNKEYNTIVQLSISNLNTPANAHSSNLSFPVQILIHKVNNANYEGFKSIGKIGNIENDELRMAILRYY